MAKGRKPAAKKTRMGPKTLERAERAMAQNKARLESTGSAGLASDKTLGSRGYEPGPDGDGPKLPREIASTARKRKRRR